MFKVSKQLSQLQKNFSLEKNIFSGFLNQPRVRPTVRELEPLVACSLSAAAPKSPTAVVYYSGIELRKTNTTE